MSDTLYFSLIIPVVAIILDVIIGDPHSFPHPVRFIGKALEYFEPRVRSHVSNMYLAGSCVLLLLSLFSWVTTTALISLPYLGILFGIYFSYSGLALGCLLKECRHVGSLLQQGYVEEARLSIAMLVSRDTQSMDADDIRRGLAETLSENLNDGFVAPLFYLVLFGPAGLWVYKTVSTMDSMWGYKNERYLELGYAGAKMDDLFAFIPARITALSMLIAGKFMGLDAQPAAKYFKADARKMDSPNAGWPMAMAAWLIGAQMGGKTVYFGTEEHKPTLGPLNEKWQDYRIKQLIELISKTSIVASMLLISFGLFVTAII